MINIKLLSAFIFTGSISWFSSIYDFSVTSIEGESKPLSAYEGKKILIIILPTEIDSAGDILLYSLDSLEDANEGSLAVIGIPSYEDGYTAERKNELKQWYRSILDTSIVISDGVYTHKSSGAQQHPIFSWLTDKNQNNHFDQEAEGVGQKFLVRSNGELFGVLGSRVRLGGNTIRRMLETQ